MNLFEELKRRNVFRVGIAYVLMAWVLLQAGDFALDLVDAPNWIIQSLFIIALIGLPVALFFAWAFEVTPEGIKREADVDRTQSIAPTTGRKLDRAIIVFLVLVIVLMGVERFSKMGSDPISPAAALREIGSDPILAPAKSIAVLPFADLSQGQDQGWFADGLAEEVLNALARTPDLKVSARTASFLYRDSELELGEIAARLGVAHILEGSVRSAEDRIRVTAQLIRASDGFHLWSENYDRDPADMITIQEDVARRIATALKTTMDPAELQRMTTAGTRSVEAYQAYLRGLALNNEFSATGELQRVRDSLEQYELARTLDPQFGQAHYSVASWWANQASVWTGAGATTYSTQQILEQFDLAIDLAIDHAPSELDQTLYRAEKARVNLRWSQALPGYLQFIEQRPSDALTMYNALQILEHLDPATLQADYLPRMTAAGYNNPDDAIFYLTSMRNLDTRSAADYAMKVIEVYPDHASLLYQAHRVLLMAGRNDDAAVVRDHFLRAFEANQLMELRHACVNGRYAEAAAIVAAGPDQDIISSRWLMLKTLGDDAQAEALLRPFDSESGLGTLVALLTYPWFDPSPFPKLMAWMDREGIQPKPARKMPYACTPPSLPAIAVLPFVNMSADPDNEYFSDGVAEEILNVLAGVPDLKVAARTSAFAYKGSTLGIAEIAGKLGVDYVLEGSVRKAGDQVRITAQLIKAADGFHLWSETYDRQLTNIFAIQDEIAANIAEILQVQLLGEQKNFATAQDLTPQSYEKFLKARFLMRQRNDAAMLEATRLTREVLAEQPDFPRGLAQLAEALLNGPTRSDENNNVFSEVRRLTGRALELDPDLAAAHMIKSEIDREDGQMLSAIFELRRAIELDPAEPRPYHWLGIQLASSGYLQESLEHLQKAVALEPDHANANGYLGRVYTLLGDWDQALQHFQAQTRLGNPVGYLQMLHLYALTGDLENARRVAGLVVEDGYTEQRLKLFLAALEDPENIDEFVAYVDAQPLPGWGVSWTLQRDYAVLGLYDKALQLSLNGARSNHDWAWSDRMAEARNRPAFNEILAAENLFEVWDELGPPPACRKTADGYDCSVDKQ